jgi:two-component system aerobic respiration control sensor histidine kinase ArcB
VLAKPTDSATLARATLGACVTARRLQGGAARHGLDGLSAATVAAMTEAFRAQWRAFRKQIADARRGEPAPSLADAAHRLAGNTAQLGLTELTEPLRLLEKRLRAGSSDIGDLLARLDRPAERLASWRRLAEKASAP